MNLLYTKLCTCLILLTSLPICCKLPLYWIAACKKLGTERTVYGSLRQAGRLCCAMTRSCSIVSRCIGATDSMLSGSLTRRATIGSPSEQLRTITPLISFQGCPVSVSLGIPTVLIERFHVLPPFIQQTFLDYIFKAVA